MPSPSLAELIEQINFAVDGIEVRFKVGEVLVSDIESLKENIDQARLRLWMMMQAPVSQDRLGLEERFRMRRARELCGRLAQDLEAGRIATRHPEFAELTAISEALHKAVTSAGKKKKRKKDSP